MLSHLVVSFIGWIFYFWQKCLQSTAVLFRPGLTLSRSSIPVYYCPALPSRFNIVPLFRPTAYWNSSSLPHHGNQGVRQRAVAARDESTLMDDESRRLIEDANLLISRDSLILCDIIGQGQLLLQISQGDPASHMRGPESSLIT